MDKQKVHKRKQKGWEEKAGGMGRGTLGISPPKLVGTARRERNEQAAEYVTSWEKHSTEAAGGRGERAHH